MALTSAELSSSTVFPDEPGGPLGKVTATIFYDDQNGDVDHVEVLNESAKEALVVAYWNDQEIYRETHGPGLHVIDPSDYSPRTFKWGKGSRQTDLSVNVSV